MVRLIGLITLTSRTAWKELFLLQVIALSWMMMVIGGCYILMSMAGLFLWGLE